MPNLKFSDFKSAFKIESTDDKDLLSIENVDLKDLDIANKYDDIKEKKPQWDYNNIDPQKKDEIDPFESFDVSVDQFQDFIYNIDDDDTEATKEIQTEGELNIARRNPKQLIKDKTEKLKHYTDISQNHIENFNNLNNFNLGDFDLDVILIILMGIFLIILMCKVVKMC